MKILITSFLLAALSVGVSAQSLLNIDIGVGNASRKMGFAATGESTNDFWNLYRHYDPKYGRRECCGVRWDCGAVDWGRQSEPPSEPLSVNS